MAEIIDFLARKEKQEEIENRFSEDEEHDNASIISKEVFSLVIEVLEDLGYEFYRDHKLMRDIEAISFLASAIIYRAHGNYHPGTEILKVTQKVIAAMVEEIDEPGNTLEIPVATNDNKSI